MKEIEEYLRENKPSVKADPSFILETRRRMKQVEGIKAEVDRQRSHGRMALVVALLFGLALGALAMALAFLYPVDVTAAGEGLWQDIRLFLQANRQYLIYPVAAMAVALSVALGRKVSPGLQ